MLPRRLIDMSRKLVLPLVVLGLLSLPLGCYGCLRWWYPFWTTRAITSNRAYYEALVRQIEQDDWPANRPACYVLRGDRLAGKLERLNLEDRKGEFFEASANWKLVSARRTQDGNLIVRIPVYVSPFLTGFGVMYSRTELSEQAADSEVGPEGGASRVDEHWWTFDMWLGH